MSVRVGLIGAGIMGADHAHLLAGQVHGAELVAICDADKARAQAIAEATSCGLVEADPEALIGHPSVDAVLVASPDRTHGPLTLACLKAGKPVLCEKPLSQSSAECLAVIDAEVRGGKRLVQVGFMRRFDQAYIEMKQALADRKIGRALVLHCYHRNVSAPSSFTGQMAITNSAPHEFDIARYVLGAEFKSISVFRPKSGDPGKPGAPVFMVAETEAGQLVNIEINNNADYGYDVRGELVGETGTVAMRSPTYSTIDAKLSHSVAHAPDWRQRFSEAYRRQNQAWIDAISTDDFSGADAWDGYCASLVAEVAVKALEDGRRCDIALAPKPAFYAAGGRS